MNARAVSPRFDGKYDAVPVEIPVEKSTLPLPPEDAQRTPLVLHLPDGQEVKLDRTMMIGQSSRCDVTVRDPRVSREHCAIEVVSSRVRVRDLGSTNGTWLNGVRVTSACELRAGSLLTLGSVRLRVALERAATRLLGESRAMHELRSRITRLAAAPLSLLIYGETGTGKELVAQALHEESGRAGRFVAVNCGSIPKDLVESELFGHERGAFTGAVRSRTGVFEEAHGGTLFLDEIGELPLQLQTRLLRVLETRHVRPVGANREVPVDARVIAATHVDVRAAVRAGVFRADLFYRLGGELPVPPLRAREGDVALLARHFVDELTASTGRLRLPEETLAKLEHHGWPGNVRELKLVLQQAVLMGDGLEVRPEDVVFPKETPRPPTGEASVRIDGRSIVDIEKDVLRWAFDRYEGNRTQAAAALGMAKSTLCDKVKRYGIEGTK